MEIKNIINLLLQNRNFLLKYSFLTAIIIFTLIFLVFPVSYKSAVSVLPPEKNSNMGGLSSLLGGGVDISSLITGGLANANSQLFVEIIRSRTAAEYVINKNNLIQFYKAEDMEDAVRKLQKTVEVDVSKEGIIRLSTEFSTGFLPMVFGDKEKIKKLCADVSNSFIEALDHINRKKLTSKARNAREYIEEQIIKTRAELNSVEASLMTFQKSNKAISLPDQVKNSIETAAKIKTEIIKTEVELGLASKNLRENNKTLLSLQEKLQQLNQQYSKIEVGSPDYLLTFREVPELGKTMASLVREVKIQNEVYLMLQQQYYKERIQENRDLPTVEILDKAIPSKKASGSLFVPPVLGGIFSFTILSFILIFSENKKLGLLKKYV